MSHSLQRTLLGLDPAAVDAALAKRAEEHRRELTVLQQQLQFEWREQEDLQQRMFAAEERFAQQRSLASPLDAVRLRLEGSSPLMRDVVERMVRDMEANMDRERAAMLQQIARLDERILAAQQQLNQLLEQAAQVAGAAGQGEHEAAEVPPSGRLAAFMPLASEPGAQPQAARAPERQQQSPAPLAAPAQQSPPLVEPATLQPQPEPEEEHEPLVVRELPVNPAAADPRPTVSPAAALKPVRPADVTAGVDTETFGYIAGKVLGQDLHGQSGVLIAGKGTPISAEIVDLAQAEGVISDLILHMTTP